MWLWSRSPKSAKAVSLLQPARDQEDILSSSIDSESSSSSSSSSSNHHRRITIDEHHSDPRTKPIEEQQPDQGDHDNLQSTPDPPRVADHTRAHNVVDRPSNLILNHHPNLNFLNSNTATLALNSTPIPSFPKLTNLPTTSPSLKTLQETRRQSELNFFRHIYHNPSVPSNQHPHQQPSDHQSPSIQSHSFTLRLVDQPQADQSSSAFLLPYPNPDLSLMTDPSTPIESGQRQPCQASNHSDLHPPSSPSIHQRPISALPNRTQTPFKPFKPQPFSSLPFDRTRSPLSSSLDQPDQCPRTTMGTRRTAGAADHPTPHEPLDSTRSKQLVESITEPIDSPTPQFDLPASPIDSPSKPIHPPIEPINSPRNLISSPINAHQSPSKPCSRSPIQPNKSPTKPLDSPTQPINPSTKPFNSSSDDCVEAPAPPPSSPTRPITSPKVSTESFQMLIDPPRVPSQSPRKSTGVPPRCHGSPKKSGGPKTSAHSPIRVHGSPIKSPVSPLKFTDSSNEANLSPRKPGFRTASAAISSVIKPADNVPQVSSSTMAQVMNELESRTKDAPQITKITFQDQINLPPHHARSQSNPITHRFTQVHGKEFAKYDSITNHYAAKRKVEESGNGQSAANPVMKRAKVSNLGLPKPGDHQPGENTMEPKEAQRKRQDVKRQLELARSRRKSNTSKQTKPTPSGFSSFGSRLLRSAVKTVTKAFKGTQLVTNKADGVGFGVPAGLGVGPAKAPPSPIRKDVQPIRSIVKPPSTRLPPAGLHRITSSTLVGATNRRRVLSGPPVASSNSLASTKNSSLANQPQTQGNGPGKSVSVSKSTWQPKTLPKPTVPTAGSMTSARPKASLNNSATSATSGSIMKSRIPKVSAFGGQTVIRATLKTIVEGTARTQPNCPPSVPSLPAFTKSSKIAVGIGQSNKVLPTKLSQPIRSTKPLKSTVRSTSMTAASRESQRKPFGSSLFVGGKTKSSISSNSTLKEKGKRLSISNRSKFVSMQKKRRSSFGRTTRRRSSLSVGTKALSHRVS